MFAIVSFKGGKATCTGPFESEDQAGNYSNQVFHNNVHHIVPIEPPAENPDHNGDAALLASIRDRVRERWARMVTV